MSHYSEFTSAPARRGSRRRRNRASDAVAGQLDEYESEDPVGRSFDEAPDWDRVGIFGAGLAIGIALGAGVALLLAPRSGEETRELLGERTRYLGGRMAGGIDDLRGGVERATRRSRRKVRRGLTRGRWMVEDARG